MSKSDDSARIFTWFTPFECWHLSDLEGLPSTPATLPSKYDSLVQLPSIAHAAEAAGQAIPLPVIRPVARWVADRLRQHADFESSCIHSGIPRLHLDSPVAQRSKALLLILAVHVQSSEPLVLVMPAGSLFGCAQVAGNPNRDATLKPVVQKWLRLMGVQDEPEHIKVLG